MNYEDIYSRFLQKMDDKSFYKLSTQDAYEKMNGFLHEAYSEVYINKLFSNFEFDDITQSLNFVLNKSINEKLDNEFVADILSERMKIAWMQPQIDNQRALSGVIIGGKEEKTLKNDLKTNQERQEALEKRLKKKIGNYGYNYNSYIEEA